MAFVPPCDLGTRWSAVVAFCVHPGNPQWHRPRARSITLARIVLQPGPKRCL